jgi:molecular chaperone GrpE (heat shock protein)
MPVCDDQFCIRNLRFWLQGLYKQMVETFKSLGVEAVPGVGQPFDPNFHDAIAREENDDLPDGTVLKEFRRGFRLGNALLRPAMVQVPPPPPGIIRLRKYPTLYQV